MKKNRGKFLKILAEIAILAVVAVVLILVSRNHDVEKKKQIEEEVQLEEEEAEKIFEVWYSYKKYEPYLTEAAARFTENTGIEVKLNYYTSIDYLDKVAARTEEGNGPDLFLISEDNMQNAVLLGIAEQNEDEELLNEENYYSKALKSLRYVNKNYGYPLGFETSVFAANMMYVDEMPLTFDDVKEYADNFNPDTEEESGEMYSSIQAILKWNVSDIFFTYGFLGAYLNLGGEYGDDPNIIDVTNSNAVKAGEYLQMLSQYFYSDSSTTTYETIIDDFVNNRLVFTLVSADIVNVIAENNMDVQLSVLPDLTDSLESKALSVTDVFVVNPYGDMKDAAIEFARFCSYDMADEMYDLCGIIAAKNIEYENKYLNVFADAYEESVGMPKLMTTSDYWLRVNTVTTNTWIGEDVQELLNNLYSELNERIN